MKKTLIIFILAFVAAFALNHFSPDSVGACSCQRPRGDSFSLEIESVTFNGEAVDLQPYKKYEVNLSGAGKQAHLYANDSETRRDTYEAHYVYVQ